MMPDEKDRLLALLNHQDKWCRGAEAANAQGDAVQYDDAAAVAWDLTGAMCQLFGWPRARVLFGQLDRHFHGKRVTAAWPRRDAELDAMEALQGFNDRFDTTFEMMRGRLESIPVWRETASASAPIHEVLGIRDGKDAAPTV